jgi:hypothetical protein
VTSPLTPAGCDLRDFPHTPIFRARLFGSSFHARATDAEWRAGVTLWLKSWDQVPAGSLPDDDIELCRLAELARDMKTWRKVKDGALRGWGKCDDGRLYHPVVAEGVNNAISAKAAQRSKTAKGRIAALEKHLSKATDKADIERLTDEIRKLKQTLSQTFTESVTDPNTESKGREGKGEGRDISSEANASDGAAPPASAAKPKTAEDMAKAELWRAAVSVLEQGGCPPSQCRTFMGKLVGDYTFAVVQKAVAAAVNEQPADAREYLKATCMRLKGDRSDPITVPSKDLEKSAEMLAEFERHKAEAMTPAAHAAREAAMAKLRGKPEETTA